MKITKRLLAILVAVATMTTTAAAANVLEGTGSATGEVPVTIQVTGLTIRATLPVSINLPVDINTVAHDAMVSTTLTVANNTMNQVIRIILVGIPEHLIIRVIVMAQGHLPHQDHTP